MSKYKKQSHVVWKCDYHIVWTPKYRFRVLSSLVKELVDHDIRMLSDWKGCEVLELNVQVDHVHLVISVPPKVAISELMGILKGKLAIKLFKNYPQLKKNRSAEATLLGESFLVAGLFCQHRGSERRPDSALRQVPGRGRPQGGESEPKL